MTVTSVVCPCCSPRSRSSPSNGSARRSSGSTSAAPTWPTTASTEAPDQRIKLILPDPATGAITSTEGADDTWWATWLERPASERGHMRTYTIRDVRGSGEMTTLVVDMVLHLEGHSSARAPRGPRGPCRATGSWCSPRAAATPTVGSSSPPRPVLICSWWATRRPCPQSARCSSSCPPTPGTRSSRCRSRATSRTYAIRRGRGRVAAPRRRSARSAPARCRRRHLGIPEGEVEVAPDEIDPTCGRRRTTRRRVTTSPATCRAARTPGSRRVEGGHRAAPAPGQRRRPRPPAGRLHGLLAPRRRDEVVSREALTVSGGAWGAGRVARALGEALTGNHLDDGERVVHGRAPFVRCWISWWRWRRQRRWWRGPRGRPGPRRVRPWPGGWRRAVRWRCGRRSTPGSPPRRRCGRRRWPSWR